MEFLADKDMIQKYLGTAVMEVQRVEAGNQEALIALAIVKLLPVPGGPTRRQTPDDAITDMASAWSVASPALSR